MHAAIYARKSTEQSGVADDQKSVARQIEHATAFAHLHGWDVADAHVYVDDGISGAKFEDHRPGLMRLLQALKCKPRPAFDVLVMSEQSRLGREQHQTAVLLGTIMRAGVRVFFYLDGKEITYNDATSKFLVSVTGYADEVARELTRLRTRDAMMRKAKAGHVTGGRVFGYDNVRVAAGHVERRINDAEAAVVRRMFTLAAAGHGLRVIAHTLNREGLGTPRPHCAHPAGWVPSNVKVILARPLYHGVIEWDRHRRNSDGRQLAAGRNADPLRIEAPHLRIIAPELAAAAAASRATRRAHYLTVTGQLRGVLTQRSVKYLLTGLLQCPCGATFEAQGPRHGRRPAGVYLCSAARRKGRAICASTVRLLIPDTDAAVLETIERQVLDEEMLLDAVDHAFATIVQDRPSRDRLLLERDRLARELAHLAGAVAAGGSIPSLLDAMRQREARRAEIGRALSAPVESAAEIRASLVADVRQWKAWLHQDPVDAQRTLRQLLDGPIVLSDVTDRTINWTATSDLTRLLPGWSTEGTSPARFTLPGPLQTVSGVFARAA